MMASMRATDSCALLLMCATCTGAPETALCAITFWLAHWIVSRFDEDILNEDVPEAHDVR